LVHLTPKEFALLAELARHHGRIITHAQLLRSVWGRAHEQDVEYLRVTVRSLRAKLEETPTRPVLILNEPGIGYRLAAEDRGLPLETDRAEVTKPGRSD
jgi:two-component system KDP operon response regulator KdpE